MYCCNGTFTAMKDPAHDPTVASHSQQPASREAGSDVGVKKQIPAMFM